MQIYSVSGVNAPTIAQQTDKPLFKQGERINADVISVDGRSVSLKLEDGSTLLASRSATEAIRPGDTVTLEVNRSSASSAELRLTEVNSQPVMPEISREQAALMRVSCAPTPTAASNMRTLERLSIPASTQTLERMAKIQQEAPGLAPSRAALLASTDIAVSADNIKAFSAWLDSPVSASVLANALNEFSTADPQAAKAVLEAFAANTGGSDTGAAAMDNAAGAAADKANVAGAGAPVLTPQSGAASPAQAAKAIPTQAADSFPASAAPAQAYSRLGAANDGSSVLGAETAGTAGGNISGTAKNSAAMGANERQPQLSRLQSEYAMSAPGTPASEPDAAAATGNLASHGGLTGSPPLKRVLGELFLKLSEADSAAASRGEAVKEAVTKLPQSVAKLSSALGEAASRSQAAQPPLQASTALASQLSLGSELGGMLYTQIPLRSESEHSTADLYIVKRDRGAKNIDDANATVALCIETEYLGRVESLIRIEKNDLTLRFRVETEREAKFIKSRLSELRALDFPAQYTLRGASVTLADEPLTLDNATRTLQKEFSLRDAAKGIDIQV